MEEIQTISDTHALSLEKLSLRKIPTLKKRKGKKKGMIRSNSHEAGGSAQQTVSVVRLANSQGECRAILASDRKYNIL